MAISQKDLEFMERVAEVFRQTRTDDSPEGSIQRTARLLALSRTKVAKILLTMGEVRNPHTAAAMRLRKKGRSIREIAAALGISEASVSIALPYADKVDNTLDPSRHAQDVRDYRAYER